LAFERGHESEGEKGMDLFELIGLLGQHVVPILGRAIAAGVVALGVTYLVEPIFTATTTFLLPQQQSAAASVLASLGPQAGIAGVAAPGIRTPADQYVAALRSVTASDRITEALSGNVRTAVNKKEGLMTVQCMAGPEPIHRLGADSVTPHMQRDDLVKQNARDWTQVFSPFGSSVATVQAMK
jgi:hypothetical protein